MRTTVYVRLNCLSSSSRVKTSSVGRPWGQWCESATVCRCSSRAAISTAVSRSPALIAALQATVCSRSSNRSRRSGWPPPETSRSKKRVQHLARIHVRQHRRKAGDQHRVAAEGLDPQAELPQHVAVLQCDSRFRRAQIDRLRHQQVLRLQRPGVDPRADLLEEYPLVQGVLVDDRHAFFRFRHEVAIVDLQRPVAFCR